MQDKSHADAIFESPRDAVVDAAKRVGPPAEFAQRCLRDAFRREDLCIHKIIFYIHNPIRVNKKQSKLY